MQFAPEVLFRICILATRFDRKGEVQVVAGIPTLRCRTTKRQEPCGQTRGFSHPKPSTSHAIESVRSFPRCTRSPGFIFFDNGAGAQIPQDVFDAMNGHLLHRNVQRGGRYSRSVEVDATIVHTRPSVAALINARNSDEIAFGMNATSFLRLLSLAIGRTLATRNEIVVSDLDHEANIATWMQLEREGARIL